MNMALTGSVYDSDWNVGIAVRVHPSWRGRRLMEYDSTRVVISAGSEQFQIFEEFLNLPLFPGVAPLIVRNSENSSVEKLFKGHDIVHWIPSISFSFGQLSQAGHALRR